MNMDRVWTAFLLASAAGLATGIGSFIAFFFDRTNKRFLAFALGFSGGVMLYISFMELLAEARQTMNELYGMKGTLAAVGAFFGGIALALLIDRLVPESGNPNEVRQVEEMDHPHHKDALFRSGLFFALAITIFRKAWPFS